MGKANQGLPVCNLYIAVVTSALKRIWTGWKKWKIASEIWGRILAKLIMAIIMTPLNAPRAVKGACLSSSAPITLSFFLPVLI